MKGVRFFTIPKEQAVSLLAKPAQLDFDGSYRVSFDPESPMVYAIVVSEHFFKEKLVVIEDGREVVGRFGCQIDIGAAERLWYEEVNDYVSSKLGVYEY